MKRRGPPLSPRNVARRDAILWALRDGAPNTSRGIAEILDVSLYDLVDQIQRLCRVGELERVRFDGGRVAYRRTSRDADLDAAFGALCALLDESPPA